LPLAGFNESMAVAGRRRFAVRCGGVFARLSHNLLQRDRRVADWTLGRRRSRWRRVSPEPHRLSGSAINTKEIDRMTTRKHSSHARATPQAPKAPVREPGKPLPKQATQQQAGTSPSGATQQSAQGSAQGEYGEGNYKASREYDEGLKRHIATHDVEREARDAAPRSRREAEDMERAEETGRARGRGDDIEEDQNA
jgi:hypothetical protein